jgi:serine/threonine protein kinase
MFFCQSPCKGSSAVDIDTTTEIIIDLYALKNPPRSTREAFESVKRSMEGKWTVDNFVILSQLGDGGTSIVYSAVEKRSGYKVALKVMKKDSKKNKREIDLHQSLRHENIVNMLGYFNSTTPFPSISYQKQQNKSPTCVMILELCDGSLADYIDSTGRGFPEEDAARYFKNLLDAVGYLHENNLIHCDITPSNVLFDQNQTKLADFGMTLPKKKSKSKDIIGGSTQYMAPEYALAWRGSRFSLKKFDHRVDLFSLGAVLFEMIFGYRPYHVIEKKDRASVDSTSDDDSSIYDFFVHVGEICNLCSVYGYPEEEETEYPPTVNLASKKIKIPPLIFMEEISEEAKDLITRLMDPNPETRISLTEAKQHSWFEKFVKYDNRDDRHETCDI